MADDLITGFPVLTTEELLALVRQHAYGKKPYGRRVPRYLSLAFCNVLTAYAFADVQEALTAKRFIDQFACGHCCQRWHAILDLETRQYVTTSLFDLFTRLSHPLIDLTARTPRLVQRIGPWRRLLIPGVGERGPWLHYAPNRTTWNFEYHAGEYRLGANWDARLDDLGIETLLGWIFTEVGHNMPRPQALRMFFFGGQLWSQCPVAFARPLVSSLHAFLTGITRKCERDEARAAYRKDHPELPRFYTINAGDLMRLPRELTRHDFWCALRDGGTSCSCTWPVEYGDVMSPATKGA
jgi:hypothetical protein